MDWTAARERNTQALLRILALLSGMIGLVKGAVVPHLPRYLHVAALGILRPAESALRRMVVIEARGLSVAPGPARTAPVVGAIKRGNGAEIPCFALIEPLQRVGFAKLKTAPGYGPRISFFDGFDPVYPAAKVPMPDDPVDARRLCRRLLAMQRALETLPQQAKRLARWLARREAGLLRTARTRALRPGRPPGYRARGRHPVDELLENCHALALYTLAQPPEP